MRSQKNAAIGNPRGCCCIRRVNCKRRLEQGDCRAQPGFALFRLGKRSQIEIVSVEMPTRLQQARSRERIVCSVLKVASDFLATCAAAPNPVGSRRASKEND